MASGQGLTLLVGPANAGKVSLLLERYLVALDRDPILIVPYRSDVERVERELLARRGALLGGQIGTFDDLFERLAREGGSRPPVVSPAQRSLLVRNAVSTASLNGFRPSARFTGFADALGGAIAELESGLVDPGQLEGDLASLYTAYRAELDRLGLSDRDLERRHAAERVAGELDAWAGRPVFAYGFEDLTGAEWALLQALAGRAELTVSLPYEPGRAAFESLRRTSDDLAALAAGRIEELGPRYGEVAPPALAHLERHLFASEPPPSPPLEGAIRFLEGAGGRGTLELVAEEILELVRGGTAPEEILLVCPSLDRHRAPLETALGALGVPYAVEGRLRLGQTAFGQALLSLLRFEWLGGARRDLYSFLRSPFSGLTRAHVDYLEGRLRGRAVREPARVIEETLKLRGQPLRMLDTLREAPTPLGAVRALARPRRRTDPRGDLRGARARDRPTRARRRARPGSRDRPPPRAHAAHGGRLPARPGGREPPAAAAGLPVSRRRGAAGDRRALPRVPAREAGSGPARALLLLYGVHAALEAPVPRPRGRDRRGLAAGGEPVLAGGACALRARRRRPLDAPAAALGAHLATRPRADRQGAASGPELARGGGAARGRRARSGERLGATPRTGPRRVLPANAAHGPRRRRGAERTNDVLGHRARGLRRLLVDLVPRARDRAADDRRRGRRAPSRDDRSPGALQVLLGAPEAGRQRAGGAGTPRREPWVPPRVSRRVDRDRRLARARRHTRGGTQGSRRGVPAPPA